MDNLSTGDILIYSNSEYISVVIKAWIWSEYMHTSIVLRIDLSYLSKIYNKFM
jgi:hypothetical protein